MSIFAAGLGLQTTDNKGNPLEVYFHKAFVRNDKNADAVDNFVSLCYEIGYLGGNQTFSIYYHYIDDMIDIFSGDDGTVAFLDSARNAQERIIITILENDDAPANVAEAYLKLNLLSSRAIQPHGQILDGIFGILPNVAWTSEGAISLEDLPARQLSARSYGGVLHVYAVDKFPPMADHIVPSGVRIGDASRVRFGAHLAEGTTVMHEGFVNFNAGTLGAGMIEGRISAGVIVGKDSDLGGGCSTMGTLSGGNNVVISVGEKCLIGANAGIGISLGDRCTVEAGLYLTAASKVSVLDDDGNEIYVIKALKISGKSDMLFRRNSQSGKIECVTNRKAIDLNEELHINN